MTKNDNAPAMQRQSLENLLARRFSCRAFLPEPLSRDLIVQILTAAQRTASWSNTQPWHIYLVGGHRLEVIRAAMAARASDPTPTAPEIPWPAEIRGVHRDRRRACGWGLYRTLGIEAGDREASERFARENYSFFGAPHVALVCIDRAMGAYGALDAGGWISTFMTVAAAAGVDTVAQAALARWPDIWRAHLDIPAEHAILAGVSFGHADHTAAANRFRTDRAPLDEVVTWSE